MNIAIVCQARMSSTRLPGKVLLPLAGAPLLVRMIERLQRSSYGSSIVVATTTATVDDPIAALAARAGVHVTRGHATDLLDRHYQAATEVGADIVVKIPSDCPLIDPAVIDTVIDAHMARASEVDYTSNLHPATYPDGNDVEVMSIDTLRHARDYADQPHEREHTTPWMWDANPSVRCQNILWQDGRDLSMTHRWTIDYPEDYVFIRSVYDALYPTMPSFGIAEILRFLDQHPEVAAMNAPLAGVNWYRQHLHALQTIDASMTKQPPIQPTHAYPIAR